MKKRIGMIMLTLVVLLAASVMVQAEGTFKWYPRLGNVTTNSIDLAYLTEAEADTYVQYALQTDYEAGQGWSGQTEATHGTLFRVALEGLQADSQYVYQVVVNDTPATEVATFRTAPTSAEDFTFVAYGDTRTHQDKHKLLADRMAQDENQPRFAVNVGDLISNGNDDEEWLDFSNAIQNLGSTMAYYSAIGNHEFNSENYYNNLALPQTGGGQNHSEWYSFDYAGVHFIVLDSNIMDKYTNPYVENPVEKQAKWMIEDLEAHKDARWIVAVFHMPVYTSHPTSVYPQLQEKWIPIFDKYGVDLVLSGHNHIYERVFMGGRQYIVTGGGGAPFDYEYEYEPRTEGSQFIRGALLQYTRVKVTEDKLYVEVVQTHKEADDFVSLDETDEIIDQCVIENIPPQL